MGYDQRIMITDQKNNFKFKQNQNLLDPKIKLKIPKYEIFEEKNENDNVVELFT